MENTISVNKSDYDNIELQIKKDQAVLKKGLDGNFLKELNDLVKLGMMIPKDKKEQGVTEEQLKLEFLKLFLKQKQFKNSDRLLNNNQYLAIYNKLTGDVGRVVSLNIIDKTITYHTYYNKSNNTDSVIDWKDVLLFDYNTIQMETIFDLYKRGQNASLSFMELYAFLSDKEFRTKIAIKKDFNFSNGFGAFIQNASEHPMIKKVILERNIPKEEITRDKRKLQKLDVNTLELIEDFVSVREATEITGISSSTISNVTCKGPAAAKYLEAGGFKWQWSNEPNYKYKKIISES